MHSQVFPYIYDCLILTGGWPDSPWRRTACTYVGRSYFMKYPCRPTWEWEVPSAHDTVCLLDSHEQQIEE